jgi:anti-sigma factor (TIGR02949 family)
MRAMPTDCARFTDLLDALADGELRDSTATEVESHLAVCPACAAELAAIIALRADLARLRQETAPEELRRRVLAALSEMPSAMRPRRRMLELVAAGFAGLALGVGGGQLWSDSPAPLPEHDLLAAHGRALLAGTPPQVAAGDPHRVKPWLSAHLPVSPRVEDSEGFPLQGARLDLIVGQPVAAILYRRRDHAITVFAAPADQSQSWPTRAEVRRGFNLLPWTANGVRYVAVSDLNMAELTELATRLGATAGGMGAAPPSGR